jgi:hypothetical protein
LKNRIPEKICPQFKTGTWIEQQQNRNLS